MGKTHTIEHQRILRNNDPLAHVYLMQDTPNDPFLDRRIKTEFITDMGERLESQPFLQPYAFTIDTDEIIYETGLRYMDSLRQSHIAARHDVAAGSFNTYHAARQEAFLLQGEKILEWANDQNNKAHIIVFSLCPSDSELNYSEAKRQSFKPDRMMASVQLHTKNGHDGETIAFSLDGLTLERLQLLFRRLGINAPVAETTIEQLTQPIAITEKISPSDTVAKIITTYDAICQEQIGSMHIQGIHTEKNIVEANSFVSAHPEVYELYKTIVTEVAKSYNGYVTKELATVVHEQLAVHYRKNNMPKYLALRAGHYLSEQGAAELVEYLRRQAIPEYLTQKLQRQVVQVNTRDFAVDIGSAGAAAAHAGRQYDGACPSSVIANMLLSADKQAEQFGIKQTVVYEAPKPIMSKGDFDVLPIGSCPVCGAECGTGIRNKKSGRWYCTQVSCSAYREEIYNFVFGEKPKERTNHRSHTNQINASTQRTEHAEGQKDEIRDALKQNQDSIWMLKNAIYEENLSETERAKLITELVQSYQEQRALLRLALGGVSIGIL